MNEQDIIKYKAAYLDLQRFDNGLYKEYAKHNFTTLF